MGTNGFVNNWDNMSTDNTWTTVSPAIYEQTYPQKK